MTEDDPADIPDDETYLETDIDAEDGRPYATRELLTSVEHALRGAPENRRYDLELTLRERTVETEDEHQ